MTSFLIVFSLIYLAFMIAYALKCWRGKNSSGNPAEFLFAGGNIGAVLAFLGISATLFSTFTLQGMPSFFNKHGVGAWVFLGVTDVSLAGILLYFGLRLRKLARELSTSQGSAPRNLVEMLKQAGHGNFVIMFYVLTTTMFLIPYVTIQIKGSSMLFQSALPVGETHLFWSVVIVAIMLLYSTFGGIRAIFVTDAVQGIILLIAAWAVAFFAIDAAGGVAQIFTTAATSNIALMSTPGPVGVLSWQFLLISFISIILMPYVQPQLATRVLVAKSDIAFARAAVGLGLFAILVILPTVFIGLRGVAFSDGNFLVQLLSNDVPPFFHALFIIGVVAAAMSTSDSQLMAIGTEWGSSVSQGAIQDNPKARLMVKLGATLVALVALGLAQTSFQSLILFSINSFIGTSFLLPLIYTTALPRHQKGTRRFLVAVSCICVVMFFAVLAGLYPKHIDSLRTEVVLYLGMLIATLTAHITNEKITKE